jgi:hypothetical protein
MVKYRYKYESTVDFRDDPPAMLRYLNSRGEDGYRLIGHEIVRGVLMFTWEVTENE